MGNGPISKGVKILMNEELSEKIVNTFAKNFINQFKQSSELFERNIGIDKDLYLPKVFNEDHIAVNSYYSTDREHLMLIFRKSNKNTFNYNTTVGNIFDVFDFYGVWKRNNCSAIKIEDSRNINLKSVVVKGARPVDLYGEIELIAEDFEFTVPFPNNTSVKLEYVMVFSKNVFLELVNVQRELANQIVISYSDFFEKTGEKLDSTSNKRESYLDELKQLKNKMYDYFFSGQYKETEIDQFIFEHPEILKFAFDLINYKSQITLKDIHGQYGQDLKPDLLGFDSIKKTWYIVDYKLPHKKIIRAAGSNRASFTADITQLRAQLQKYRDYFSDYTQRNYVNEKYKIDVKQHPPTIGIIGILKAEEIEDFNHERFEQPGWFQVLSYNELYEKVCEYIDRTSKIN